MKKYIVGVSGASGIILAYKLVKILIEKEFKVELVFSRHGLYTAALELGKEYSSGQKFVSTLPAHLHHHVTLHGHNDMGCAIASGTYPVDGMIILPCSMATLAAISMGLGDNALRRAADVTLKEKRPLIVVPRETPFNEIHLENLLKLSRLGATILPPIPAWYTKPKTIDDIEDFIIGRVLDALHIPHALYKPWPSSS